MQDNGSEHVQAQVDDATAAVTAVGSSGLTKTFTLNSGQADPGHAFWLSS